ncbi:MAG: hypothetical protein SGPRY_014245, partial [Prymnesium sp.]
MSNGTLLEKSFYEGDFEVLGQTMRVLGATLLYTLPAPPGRWLPNSMCEIYRAPCFFDPARVVYEQCLSKRAACKILPFPDERECTAPLEVQPCPWKEDPSLLGRAVHTFSSETEEESFPYACGLGVLGSSDPALQQSATCAGLCPAGFICPTLSTSVPLPCAAGSFCPNGSVVPLPCAAGFFSNASNLRSSLECTPCPAGSSCVTQSVRPEPCPPGAFSGPQYANCQLCQGGTYQSSPGSTACISCEAGGFCPRGSSAPLPCLEGTYSNARGLARAEMCNVTDMGCFSTIGSTSQKPCAPGSFSSRPRQGGCDKCPQGYFQPHE